MASPDCFKSHTVFFKINTPRRQMAHLQATTGPQDTPLPHLPEHLSQTISQKGGPLWVTGRDTEAQRGRVALFQPHHLPPHHGLGECPVTSDSATPWTGARQAPLSVGFPRQEYWSGLPFPPLGDLPDPEIKGTHLLCLLHCRQILYHLNH